MSFVTRRFFTTASRVLRADASAAASGKKGVLNFRFMTPDENLYTDTTIQRVTLPAVTGDMGVVSDHVPSICQLRPGVVEVIEEGNNVQPKKWFVPGGFALITADSTCSINSVEAIPLDDIDTTLVASELNKARSAKDSSKDEAEKAEAQIAVDVLEAMSRAK